MSHPRVAIVVRSLNTGGTESQLLSVLPEVQNHGMNIEVVTLLEPGTLLPAFQRRGILVRTLRTDEMRFPKLPEPLRALLAVPPLVRHLRESSPDIVHAFLPIAAIVGGLAAQLAGRKRIVISRRSRNFYQRKHPFASMVERKFNARASAMTANSLSVAKDLENEGIRRERTALIYNGVDVSRFAPHDRQAARVRLGIPEECVVMVKVANLMPYKGHQDLLSALGMITPRIGRDWRLFCVGRDDGLGSLLLRESARFREKVVFTGLQTDVRPYLAAADIGVLASHEEGFSNAVLESMAAGLAMIVTDVGGNAEAVINGASGLVVKPGDRDQLGEALLKLCSDEDLRRKFGKEARRRVQAQFGLEQSAAALVKLYSALLNDKCVPNHLRPPRYSEAPTECAE